MNKSTRYLRKHSSAFHACTQHLNFMSTVPAADQQQAMYFNQVYVTNDGLPDLFLPYL